MKILHTIKKCSKIYVHVYPSNEQVKTSWRVSGELAACQHLYYIHVHVDVCVLKILTIILVHQLFTAETFA